MARRTLPAAPSRAAQGRPASAPVPSTCRDAELDLGRAFREHRQAIFLYLLRRTGDPHLAEDLTQDVFANAIVALPRLDPDPSSLRPWLYTVARRRAVDARRSARPVPFERLEELGVADTDGAPGSGLAALVDAIRTLPPPQRAVVVMRLVEGLSFAEIGTALGADESACRMRFSRALRALRERLERAGLPLLSFLVEIGDYDLRMLFGYI